jgi:hypothetical protein
MSALLAHFISVPIPRPKGRNFVVLSRVPNRRPGDRGRVSKSGLFHQMRNEMTVCGTGQGRERRGEERSLRMKSDMSSRVPSGGFSVYYCSSLPGDTHPRTDTATLAA